MELLLIISTIVAKYEIEPVDPDAPVSFYLAVLALSCVCYLFLKLRRCYATARNGRRLLAQATRIRNQALEANVGYSCPG